MNEAAARLNQILLAEARSIRTALSPLGERVFFPKDIPFQAVEARKAQLNGTIGQITDGHGSALRLPPINRALSGLGDADRNAALLYSPIDGIQEVRQRWRAWQRRDVPETVTSSLPIVTAGLSHGISIAADLFGGPGRTIAIPAPFWGNYRGIFEVRGGATIASGPLFRDGAFDPFVVEKLLTDGTEPAVAILNFPSNPGGYSPTQDERRALLESLMRVADRRNLVVICDDAYLGLVYEPDIPRRSIFWDLVDAHPSLIPVKVDGATKEFAFFGGRVAFITFGLPPASPAAAAMEDKVKGLVRSSIGSPVAASQAVLLEALRDEAVGLQIETIRLELMHRYRILKDALRDVDPGQLHVQPFNSGCFALVEIPESVGVLAEAARVALLSDEDTGVIAIGPRYLRLAFCSLAPEVIPEIVSRVVRGVHHLSAQTLTESRVQA